MIRLRLLLEWLVAFRLLDDKGKHNNLKEVNTVDQGQEKLYRHKVQCLGE